MNSKTHLTDHCFGIRCGKNLSEVVKTQGEIQIHIHIFQYSTNETYRLQPYGYKKVDRKERYIVVTVR